MGGGQNIILSPVAASVPYNDTIGLPAISQTNVQGAIDYLKSGGTAGQAISSAVSTSTSSTTYALLNSMTITPSIIGNWSVIFTCQMNSTTDTYISVFVGGTQSTNSERIAIGPTGSHSFVMATSEKVTVTAGQAIEIRWKSLGTSTCLGRNLTIVKVQ